MAHNASRRVPVGRAGTRSPGPAANTLAGLVAALGAWSLAATVLPRGLPPGIIASGLLSGALLALSASAIVLVYRADRVVNFAQAGIGSLAAVLAIGLTTHFGWPWLLTLPVGTLAGASLGAATSVGVVDRMRTSPRLAATVATVGIGEVLAGGAQIFSGILPPRAHARKFTAPFGTRLGLRPVDFHTDALVAAAGVVLCLAAIALTLSRTTWGLAFRAASDDPERSRLVGVPPAVISLAAWAAAGAFGALAVMWRAPLSGAPSVLTVATSSTALLVRILVPAVFGGMRSLRRAAAAALAIGVLDEAATWTFGRTVYVDVLLVIVVLVVVTTQRDRFSRRSGDSELAVRQPPPLDSAAARIGIVRWGRVILGASVAAVAVGFPLWARPSQDHAGAVVCVYAVVAVSLLVLTGWGGFLSLGQFAYAGIGGAVMSVLLARHGWDATLATGAGVAVAAAVSVVIGLPTLRVRAGFAAIGSLALAVAASSYFLVPRFVPWLIVDDLTRPVLWGRFDLRGEGATYELCLGGLAMAIIAARNLRRSTVGRALLAVRDNETAAAAAGIDVGRAKLIAFAVSGGLAGFAGCLYVILGQGMHSESYSAEASLRLFAMVIVGGLSSLSGVLLGAVVIRGTEVLFPAGWALLASGLGITALVALFPEGLGGLLFRAGAVVTSGLAKPRS